MFLEQTGRPRAPWRLLAQFALFSTLTSFFVALLGVAWLLASGGAGLGARAAGAQDVAGLPPGLFLVSSVASLGAAFVSLWLAARFLDRRRFGDFGFRLNRAWWLDLVFGMVLGAALMSVVFLAQLALGWVSVAGAFEATIPGLSFGAAMAFPVVIFVCVGVYEEMLSRGYQLRNAAEGLNFPAVGPRGAVVLAWALTSVFFGLLHAGNPNASLLSTTNITLAGVLLGLGYVLTGELAIPIGFHVTWNFFQGNVFGLPVSGLAPVGATFLATEEDGPDLWTGGAFGPEAGLLALAAIVAGCLFTALWVRLRHSRVAVHAPVAEPLKPFPARKETEHAG